MVPTARAAATAPHACASAVVSAASADALVAFFVGLGSYRAAREGGHRSGLSEAAGVVAADAAEPPSRRRLLAHRPSQAHKGGVGARYGQCVT